MGARGQQVMVEYVEASLTLRGAPVMVTEEANAELGPLLRAGALAAWYALLAQITPEQRAALEDGGRTVHVWAEAAGGPRYGFRQEAGEIIVSLAVETAGGLVEVALGYLKRDPSDMAERVAAEALGALNDARQNLSM